MELPISHGDYRKNPLAFRRAGFRSRPGLFQAGKRLQGRRGKFQVTKDDGHSAVLELRRSWVDPIPVVVLDSHVIRLVRPYRWQEWALPCLLVLSALLTGLWWAALLCLFLSPHLADSLRNDGTGPMRFYVFGLKVAFILALLYALAWLTYPRIGP